MTKKKCVIKQTMWLWSWKMKNYVRTKRTNMRFVERLNIMIVRLNCNSVHIYDWRNCLIVNQLKTSCDSEKRTTNTFDRQYKFSIYFIFQIFICFFILWQLHWLIHSNYFTIFIIKIISNYMNEMYDHNVFAILIAFDQRNMINNIFKLTHNLQWFHKAKNDVVEKFIINNRKIIFVVDDDAQFEKFNENKNKNNKFDVVDWFVVIFDELLKKLHNEIQLKTNSNLFHIFLKHRETKKINAKQCNIVVNDNLWIWLHDYYSTHEIAVEHDHQNETKIRKK